MRGTVFDTPAPGDSGCPPELRRAWQELQRTLETTASAVSFRQLLDESDGREKMYYI